jgi:osmoprotectant transport system ATP-binding protein
VITFEHVTKRYGDKTAVDDLTFEVGAGEVCVLIGPSGCGKTTTMRMVNRLIEPTSGRILVDGTDVTELKPEVLRRRLGYAIQSVGLFPHLNVAENIGVVPRLLGWDATRMAARAEELLSLVGLDPAEYARKYPRQLSGGEAQRIGVARALAADPPALLMDEPFGAVDPLTRERLQAEFGRIQRELGKTVIFVTHDIDEAIRLADRIAIMRNGHLEQYDTPETVLDRPANAFVRDFVGADRALKRLVRVRVTDVMREAPSVHEAEVAGVRASGDGTAACFVYVVDADGRLLGWVDTRELARVTTPADALTRVDPAQASVPADASLKEALSRMLGLGFRSIAVTDAGGRLLGEVRFHDIEGAMGQSDDRLAPEEELAP